MCHKLKVVHQGQINPVWCPWVTMFKCPPHRVGHGSLAGHGCGAGGCGAGGCGAGWITSCFMPRFFLLFFALPRNCFLIAMLNCCFHWNAAKTAGHCGHRSGYRKRGSTHLGGEGHMQVTGHVSEMAESCECTDSVWEWVRTTLLFFTL